MGYDDVDWNSSGSRGRQVAVPSEIGNESVSVKD